MTSRSHPTPRRAALALAAALLAPVVTAAQEDAAPDEAAPEVVAEALFLCDHLPPGGRDLNLTVAVAEGEPDEVTGETRFEAAPRVQLAVAVTDRVGFTVDAGLPSGDLNFDAPGASLKVLLRDPGAGGTGLAASVDLLGSSHSFSQSEAGLGLGAIRAVGPVAFRAGATLASGVRSWTPHLHTGLSAAVELGGRVRALVEATGEFGEDESVFSAGPTVKVALGERTAVMAGALFQVSPAVSTPVFTFQLTQSL